MFLPVAPPQAPGTARPKRCIACPARILETLKGTCRVYSRYIRIREGLGFRDYFLWLGIPYLYVKRIRDVKTRFALAGLNLEFGHDQQLRSGKYGPQAKLLKGDSLDHKSM